ncbi:ATP-binding protein [Marivirga lumbricoides]
MFVLLSFYGSRMTYANSGLYWEQAKRAKTAQLDLYWYISKPFVYKDDRGQMKGLEVEMMEAFCDYLKQKYDTDIQLNWIETPSFSSIHQTVANLDKPNTFGVSAFSITEERKEIVTFSDPYLSDVAVLVSSKGTPIVRTLDEINKLMSKLTAVTIRGTTYEKFLEDLKEQLNLKFETIYINSDKNILDEIVNGNNYFGFIDLPIYLMMIKDGRELTRQNFFTLRGDGYAYISPQGSDWIIPLNQFLEDPESKVKIANIISKYISPELYMFIESTYGDDNLGTSILTKEKEIQMEQIANAENQLAKEKFYRRLLIFLIIVVSVSAISIFVLLFNTRKIVKKLSTQKKQITLQEESIRNKNEQLINRNVQLTTLNEEKNNLVKILAHDLRTPINHITGLINVLQISAANLAEGDKKITSQIKDSASRLNQMIHKILDFDALEGNRMFANTEKIDINQLMELLVENFKPSAQEKEIDLQLKIEASYGLKTDYLFLTQIMENLISNAIKFSEKGTKVEMEVLSKNDNIIFTVKDQGPGFTEQDKKLAFTKYQKLSAKPTNGEPSTGLGLSIVKKYVNLLGGEVWVESELKKGSTFYVSLLKIKNEAELASS